MRGERTVHGSASRESGLPDAPGFFDKREIVSYALVAGLQGRTSPGENAELGFPSVPWEMTMTPLTDTTPIFPHSFADRRSSEILPVPPGVERRQFSSSYQDLSPAGREIAFAIDEYKIRNRRRFVTYDEMLHVIQSLGYKKS